tara:strand:- start:23 stop:244 length:222 start_codon:yes stop_codon:yes gene_type:complete
MKPKDIKLNIHEITRLEKKNCDNIRQKISEKKQRYTQDELSYIQRMNQYNMFSNNELQHIVAIFISLAISNKL